MTPNTVVALKPAPTVALTVVITILFGVFGVIPAATGSSKAAALGLPTSKYWMAFVITLCTWVLFLVSAAG